MTPALGIVHALSHRAFDTAPVSLLCLAVLLPQTTFIQCYAINPSRVLYLALIK